MSELLLGIDIGTYGSKGLLCRPDGTVVAEARREHGMSVPRPGWAEHDGDGIWWFDFVALARELTDRIPPGDRLVAVGASAIGPCLLPVDQEGRPLRPGILYGVDTRASVEIEELEARFGRDALIELGGMRLTSQAIGPKILWLKKHEPEVYERSARFLTASSYIIFRLAGEYVIDLHTASHFNPLIDIESLEWDGRFAEGLVQRDQLPELRWSDEIAGVVTPAAAEQTGIPAGTPVTAGAVDALAEAVSVGVVRPGDLMVMYGSTAFFILLVDRRISHPDLWATAGAFRDQYALAAGMATAGAATTWFRDELARDLIAGRAEDGLDPYQRLLAEAAESPPGARGVLVLPYMSGERTPIHDPDARGVIAGLSLATSRGDLYRAFLEGVAYGIRHNLEAMQQSGAPVRRVVAVGGGASSRLWLQIVSDVAGVSQLLPERTIGAAYGDAFLAGLGVRAVDIEELESRWVRQADEIEPDANAVGGYEQGWGLFRDLYLQSRSTVHALAHSSETEQ